MIQSWNPLMGWLRGLRELTDLLPATDGTQKTNESRQFPKRIQIRLGAAPDRSAKWRKSSSLLTRILFRFSAPNNLDVIRSGRSEVQNMLSTRSFTRL